LCSTLTDLLHAETVVAPDADFFALGGNSLLAVELVNRIEARFGSRPKLIDIYERPRVADFAALIGPGPAGLPAIMPQDELVMSFGQERMWFHHQLDEDTTLYNLPMVSHVHGPIDVDAVRGMWEDLARRHEVLRSNFVEVDGAPVLRIRQDLGDFARFVDVSCEPEPISAARDLVRRAAAVRFDLARDPLLRLLVVRLGPAEHVIQVTMHHAVNDGAAPKIFQRELPELYAARRAETSARLEPLPVRFRDYAKWQRDLLAGSALDHELAYWLRVLDGAPRLDLPTDLPRPARKNFTGELHAFTIDAPLLRELRALAARESVTLFVVLLAALYVVLARHSGQRDVVVGTPTSGRNRAELRGLLGYFNSTVALRADLSGEHTVAGFLRQVRSVVAEALEHQEVPFDRVVSALGGERDLSRTPIFDVCHIHQELPPTQPFDTAEVGYFDAENTVVNAFGGIPAGTAKFDLTLLTGGPEGEPDMVAALEYSTELFLPATAEKLTADYLAVLSEIAGGGAGLPLVELLEGQARPAPVVLVPTDRGRPLVARYRLVRLSTALDDLPPAFAGRGEAALLAAWLTLLAWIAGEDELAVTVPGGHVHVDLSDGPGFADLVDEVERALAEPPPAADADLPLGFGGEPASERSGMELRVVWQDGGTCRLDYATELFDDPTAVTMIADLRRLLGGLADHPELPVHEVAARHVGHVDLDLPMGAAR
jgi:acyl carrier protein